MSRNYNNNQPDYRNWSESCRELNMPASELGAAAWRRQQIALKPHAEMAAAGHGPSLLNRLVAALRGSLSARVSGGVGSNIQPVARRGATAE